MDLQKFLALIALACCFYFSASTAYSQQLFTTGTNTNWNDLPQAAVELPGSRFAIAINQTDSFNQVNSATNTFIAVTDSVGNTIHSISLPADSVNVLMVNNIHYAEGNIFLNVTSGKDTTGYNFPRQGGVIILDTALNFISKHFYTCDTGRYISSNHSILLNNKIYSVWEEGKLMYYPLTMPHASFKVFDLSGNLIAQQLVDTTYFTSSFQGSDDYYISILDIAQNQNRIDLLVMAGNALGSIVFTNIFAIETDTALNFKKSILLGCVNPICTYALGRNSNRFEFINTNTCVLGSNLTDNDKNCVIKYHITDTSTDLSTGSLLPVAYSFLPDSPGVKYPTVKNVAYRDNKVFFLGHTGYYPFNFFSGAKNSLVISCLDTNVQVNWTKFVGNDAQYFPSSILATSDGGCLVLAFRYDSLNPSAQFDHYIFRLNGNGDLLGISHPGHDSYTVQVFPNLATNELHVKLATSGSYQIQINDMNGKNVLSSSFAGTAASLNISSLPTGVYSFVILGQGNTRLSGLWLKK
jgi:hypothetical protein